MNVAQAFPAREQPDGTIWYRGIDHDGSLGVGWTSQTKYAHPDYFAPGAPAPIPYRADPWPSNADLDGVTVLPAVPDAELPKITIDGKALDWPSVMKSPIGGETITDVMFYQPPAGDQAAVENVNPELVAMFQQPTEDEMTALTEDFVEYEPPRFTEWQQYPLPPLPPRFRPKFNGWKQYLVPSPQTGRPGGFTRATTVADTLDETFGLSRWKRRETAQRILKLHQLPPETVLHPKYPTTAAAAIAQLAKAIDEAGKVGDIDKVLDVIDNLMGGKDSAEFGSAVHEWLEALDMGLVLYRDVPEMFVPHVDAYYAILARFGIVPVTIYVERVVMNDLGEETVVGTLDRIYLLVATGELILGDVKTSKTMEYSWLVYAVQLAVYGWATKMLATDGTGWAPMPKLVGIPHPSDATNPMFAATGGEDTRPAYGILMHLPSDQPERSQAITMDLSWGGEIMVESLSVRQHRKDAKNGGAVAFLHAIPAPTDHALRYAAARLALTKITSHEDGQAVYDEYADVWDDALGEFATTVAGLVH